MCKLTSINYLKCLSFVNKYLKCLSSFVDNKVLQNSINNEARHDKLLANIMLYLIFTLLIVQNAAQKSE
jgi:ABC-type microcin C transport system permease subunit YejE